VRRVGVVEHLQGPAGVTAAEHHRGIDVGWTGIAVLEHPDRVVELRVGERRGQESGPVPRNDRVQAELGRERSRLSGCPRRGHVRQHQLGERRLAVTCVDEADTDHIGRMARSQGRVQDPVFRVCRHDDQAGLG